MQNFVRGQRARINQICNATSFEVKIAVQSRRVPVFDFVCFGVDAREQLSDDRYMVFFNQRSAPGDAIALTELTDTNATFKVDLAALPASIDRLVFTVSVDGAGQMKDLDSGVFSLLENGTGQEQLQYRFTGTDFDTEGALMLAALYRKDGEWRIWAQGQGFAGDLSALLKYFGGEEAEESGAQPASAPQPVPVSPGVPPSAPVSAPVAASDPTAAVSVPAPIAGGSLQQIVSNAAPGSTVNLPRGEHQGPIHVDKPLTIEGEGAVIWAQSGPVVTVQSIGVTLRDVEIEVTAPEETVPNANVALWIAPGVGTQLHNVRARGDIIGVAAAEGVWLLPPFLNLGEFAPRVENRFQIEIETPGACALASNIQGVSLHPPQLPGGRQSVEIRVGNVAADTLLAGQIELSTGGVSRTIPLTGRTAHGPREAVQDLKLWTAGGLTCEDKSQGD